MRRAAVSLVALAAASCGPKEQPARPERNYQAIIDKARELERIHKDIIDKAWELEAEYQNSTRDNLEKYHIAKITEHGEGPCVHLTDRPGVIMLRESLYCFKQKSTKVRWMDR